MRKFTKRIFIDKGFQPEFFFSRIYTPIGIRYHVSVMDSADRFSVFFNMVEQEGSFRIINAPEVPDWIRNLEQELEQAILENGIGE